MRSGCASLLHPSFAMSCLGQELLDAAADAGALAPDWLAKYLGSQRRVTALRAMETDPQLARAIALSRPLPRSRVAGSVSGSMSARRAALWQQIAARRLALAWSVHGPADPHRGARHRACTAADVAMNLARYRGPPGTGHRDSGARRASMATVRCSDQRSGHFANHKVVRPEILRREPACHSRAFERPQRIGRACTMQTDLPDRPRAAAASLDGPS
jgi:hypothetical protein